MVIGDCRLGLWGGHCGTGRPRWGPGKLMELVGEGWLFAKWRLESEAETGAQELGGSAPGLLQNLEPFCNIAVLKNHAVKFAIT